MASKIEFAVEMTCNSCVENIKQCLQTGGINSFDIQLANNSVIVETTLPVDEVQSLLKSTGRKAVIKGTANSVAAVAIIEAGAQNIQGVVRFMRNTDDTCIVDGTIDGLQSVPHSLCVFECGDLSNGCESVGSFYNPETIEGKNSSSVISIFLPNEDGRATFRIINNLNLYDLIGRSVVIIHSDTNVEQGKKLACGIIARSAGLFQNQKMICACDGVSIWDEKNNPKASL